MNVSVKRSKEAFKGVVLDLSPIETMIVLTALNTLHADGGRNEMDKVASKTMRQQILEEIEV